MGENNLTVYFWYEPIVSQLLFQQTLKVKEHQDGIIFLLGLDEELEVALLNGIFSV